MKELQGLVFLDRRAGFLYTVSVLRHIVHWIHRNQNEKKRGNSMIVIDYQNRKPIYEQVVERFQMLIVKGILEADMQMPSVRALATELSINPNTIQKAYTILEQQGYIYPVRGKGNFVSGNQTLIEKKQDNYYMKLGELVREGMEIGITCGECIKQVEAFYEEGEYD